MAPRPPAEPTDLRIRKRQLVRDAIVDAALELFAEDGFDATSVPAIARRAGVSPATVARYFPAKEALLFPERDERVAVLRAEVLDRPPDEPPLDAVVAAFDAQPALSDEQRRRLLLARRAIARSTVLRGRAVSLLDGWRDGIADALVERGPLDGEAARVLATAIVAVLDDVATRWAAEGGTGDLYRAGRKAVAVLGTSGRAGS